MYYSSGNYEAFARPRKPEGVDNKSAYIVGSGLAALTAACYLVRDGQMKGEHIHILEKDQRAGGACDGMQVSKTWATSCAAAGRWTTISRSCGICSTPFPPLKPKASACWTSITGSTRHDPNYSLCRATDEPRSGRPHRRQVRHFRQGRRWRS